MVHMPYVSGGLGFRTYHNGFHNRKYRRLCFIYRRNLHISKDKMFHINNF